MSSAPSPGEGNIETTAPVRPRTVITRETLSWPWKGASSLSLFFILKGFCPSTLKHTLKVPSIEIALNSWCFTHSSIMEERKRWLCLDWKMSSTRGHHRLVCEGRRLTSFEPRRTASSMNLGHTVWTWPMSSDCGKPLFGSDFDISVICKKSISH